MAYGQTGSGKTYTMEGKENSKGKDGKGIIPRSVKRIFKFIEKSSESIQFSVKASILEIYNEEIRDLLNTKRTGLKIRTMNYGDQENYVENLTEIFVSTTKDVLKLLEKGKKSRSVGCHNLNLYSSRSHLLVYLKVHQTDTIKNVAKRGTLLLVDLAGSEKTSKTGAEGQRLKEANKINQSLLYLGNIINALNKGTHVPYRNSQLTRLLENSLGGNSQTTLIINCSVAAYNKAETISTLKFGTRAQMVNNTPIENIDFTVGTL